MKKLITICLLMATIFTTQAQQNINEIINNCPTPTNDDIIGICGSIYNKKPSREGSQFAFKFEDDLWEMACIEPTREILNNPEALKIAIKKIQTMWMNNRNNFICNGFPLRDANITNFSINSGFPTFLRSAIKVYKLDMNFKVTNQGTIMDYILEEIESYKSANMSTKVNELEKIYKILENAGAKHAKEL